MADDLLDRLTKALMDAMVCKCDHRPGRPGCRNHTKVVLYGVIDCDWPCPVAVRAADALLPFVRDEVADELHSVADQLACIVAELVACGPEHEEIEPFARFAKWLRSRADEVRNG
jgi:hypothetical protein